LCSDDYAGVECYIRHWCLTGKRADEIRREYLELLAMDIYHLPVYFRRTPEALYADYQVYIQSLNRVDRYVNVPSTNLPAFQAYPPVGGQLCAPALATDFGCEQTVSVAPQTVGGAHQFGRDREVFEAPVASVDFSKFKTEREHEHHHYPPGEEDCGNFPGGPGNIPGPGVPYGN
jgi:hypothetical protein